MTFRPERTNEEAGLTVFRDKDHYFKFTLFKTIEGTRLQLTSRRIGDTEDRMIARIPYRGKKIVLRVSSSGQWYSFEYGRNESKMRTFHKDVDGGFLGSPAAGRFTGTMMGLYATGNGSRSRNNAHFERIQY
jgi:alpha-N-arabinofuranosidase